MLQVLQCWHSVNWRHLAGGITERSECMGRTQGEMLFFFFCDGAMFFWASERSEIAFLRQFTAEGQRILGLEKELSNAEARMNALVQELTSEAGVAGVW